VVGTFDRVGGGCAQAATRTLSARAPFKPPKSLGTHYEYEYVRQIPVFRPTTERSGVMFSTSARSGENQGPDGGSS